MRNLGDRVAVERSIRLVEAGAEQPDKLSAEQQERIVRAAAKLPAFTSEEVAAAGRLAAQIDAHQ